MTDEPINAYAHLRAAAKGDLEAQRQIVTAAIQNVVEGDLVAGIEGLVFARLAAAQGDQGDIGNLLGLLALVGELAASDPGDQDLADNLQGEGIAIVSALADQGVEMADQMLLAISEGSTPQASEYAKEIRDRMAAM